jgi:hypothetical protein
MSHLIVLAGGFVRRNTGENEIEPSGRMAKLIYQEVMHRPTVKIADAFRTKCPVLVSS